jgi:hypothetical protein
MLAGSGARVIVEGISMVVERAALMEAERKVSPE